MRRSLRNEIAQAEHRLRRGILVAMLFSLFIWPVVVKLVVALGMVG